MSESRNAKLLQSFAAYCEAHPQERFWQALRNWCGWHYVLVSNGDKAQDTFYWEDNREAVEP